LLIFLCWLVHINWQLLNGLEPDNKDIPFLPLDKLINSVSFILSAQQLKADMMWRPVGAALCTSIGTCVG
jgi:hypothetical protein